MTKEKLFNFTRKFLRPHSGKNKEKNEWDLFEKGKLCEKPSNGKFICNSFMRFGKWVELKDK